MCSLSLLECHLILCCLYMTFNVFTVFVRISSYSLLVIYVFLMYSLSLLRCHLIQCCLYMTFNVFTVFVRMSSYSMLFIY